MGIEIKWISCGGFELMCFVAVCVRLVSWKQCCGSSSLRGAGWVAMAVLWGCCGVD